MFWPFLNKVGFENVSLIYTKNANGYGICKLECDGSLATHVCSRMCGTLLGPFIRRLEEGRVGEDNCEESAYHLLIY